MTKAYDALTAAGLVQRCERQEARWASDEELRRVHRQEHLEQVRRSERSLQTIFRNLPQSPAPSQVRWRSEEQRPANGSVYYSSTRRTRPRDSHAA